MRATKVAIADALRDDPAVSALVPSAQVFACERAVVPSLPAVELVGVSSERVGDGPMVRHEIYPSSVTVSSPTEDGCDELLDSIIRATRARLATSETTFDPINLASGERALVALARDFAGQSVSVGQGDRDPGGERSRCHCRGRRVNRGPTGLQAKSVDRGGSFGTRADVTFSVSFH